MLLNKDIFRKYDIRGIYDKNLTTEVAANVAKAFATEVYNEYPDKLPTVSVGMDVRYSSQYLFDEICNNLINSGINIIKLGVCPSPLTYFSMYSEDTDGYVMITGSHNPPEFNGIKIGTKKTVYHSEKIEKIYDNIINENFTKTDKQGQAKSVDIIPKYKRYISEYFADLKSKIASLDKEIKVVIDSGSGTASNIAPEIFRDLGVTVFELYCTPDGSFPGHHPDPTVEKNLQEAKELLLKESADLCVGFDGDADRLGALNSKGEMIWGDQLIGIFAESVAPNYQNRKVVADVKASNGLYELIEEIGMQPVMYYSGHSMIKEKMIDEDAVIGGEMSSHFFFADRYYGFDDGIYAAVRLLEAYVNKLINKQISTSAQLTDIMPKYANTPEIREFCPDYEKFDLVERLSEIFNDLKDDKTYDIKDIVDIDGLRVSFTNGWALVRASNTEPLLVKRYEGNTADDMDKIRSFVDKVIKELTDDNQKED
jgi:phosphomannomutase/phosphoglucomutase